MITASEAGKISAASRKKMCSEVLAKYGEAVTTEVTQAAWRGHTSAKVQVDGDDMDNMIRALSQLGYVVVDTGSRSVVVSWGSP